MRVRDEQHGWRVPRTADTIGLGERRVAHGPALGTDLGARWASCSYFGTVTQLSADGSTLLVSPEASSTFNPELGSRYRCAAFVYQHGASGWERAGTLFPPGVTAQGSTESTACEFLRDRRGDIG